MRWCQTGEYLGQKAVLGTETVLEFLGSFGGQVYCLLCRLSQTFDGDRRRDLGGAPTRCRYNLPFSLKRSAFTWHALCVG